MWSATLVVGANEEVCGSAWLRGEQRPFRSGDILLANAGDVQRLFPACRPTAYFTVYWDCSALERAASEAGIRGPVQWSLAVLTAGAVSAEFARLRNLLECGANAQAVETAYGTTAAALLRAAATNHEPVRTACHPGVRRAALYASAGLGESLPLEQMAREVRMSKCHLVRCFQDAMGVPPHRYRTLLRLQRARRLLETGLSVAAVADEMGFSDAPHLTRSFSEWLGVSPAAWGNAWRASNPWSEQRLRTMPPPAPR